MKRFQVEKTQRGYLAKKRKRPITQQQYYDQGVPRNVLMPPRTLLAQNILDSHGSSFFDTFSYLNFMKDYFKQNQITTPSFTDPNSLWGKITKWYRKRNESKANKEELDVIYTQMRPEKVKEELVEAEAELKRLREHNDGGDLDDKIQSLNERIEVMKGHTGEKSWPKKVLDAILSSDDYAPDAILLHKSPPPELEEVTPVATIAQNVTAPSELEETEQKEEREAAEKIYKRILANNKRIIELYNDGNPDPKDFDERRDLIRERLKLLSREVKLTRGNKTERAQTLTEIKNSHPEWLQGLNPDEVEKETTLTVAVVPPRRNDENTVTEMLEQVLKEAEDPAKRGEPSMLMETSMPMPPAAKRTRAGILNALSKALGTPLWNDKGRQELEQALKKGSTPDFITVRDENGDATTFNFDDILEKGMKGKPGVIIVSRIKEAKPREEKTRKALQDVMENKRFSKATKKKVLDRDQKKRDVLIRKQGDFRL